jgi:hypothetical protein
MVAGKDVLEKIPGLVQKKDAAALVGLRDHEDKAVRKAVRKALHLLKSKGVEIPDAPAQAWSTGATLKQMRGTSSRTRPSMRSRLRACCASC